ncbi:TPA: hypothetical protein ACH3X1_007976 [Trebouxia sp. C0004]
MQVADTSTKPNQKLHKGWEFPVIDRPGKHQKDEGTCMFQYLMLDGDSLATAELVQQVVLLNGQALIEAVHDPTLSPDTHAGLDICVLSAAGPTCLKIVCLC